VQPEVENAWRGITEHWEEGDRHQAFLALVAQHNCFAWAAARYKERAGDAIADAQLDKLRRAAMATMLATATAHKRPEKTPYRSTMVVLISLVLLAVFGLICLKLILDSRPPAVTNPAR